MRLAFGVSSTDGEHRGMVDTAPLRKTLNRALGTSTGRLPNIEKNVASGKLRAVALVTTRYATGQTVTFFSGRDIVGWERPQRRSVHTQLTVDHIMASAALPLFFPAVEVDGSWHGDGGIRLVAPLAPALHLGAGKILAISTLHRRSRKEADIPTFNGPPLPAQILGVLFNAIFLDQLDQDAHELDRVNRLLDDVPPDRRQGLRPVGLQVIRPSVDIGVLANEHEPRLPPAFRYLTRRLGTRRARTQDFLSTVMFQRDFVCRLMELGEKDGSDQAETIAAFLDS
jgi:NTE family protein